MKRVFLCVLGAMTLAGCATKQYPQVPSVTSEESSLMTCNDVKLEVAKTRSLQREIEITGEFDERTILGAVGDIGIGNGLAKSDAQDKVSRRLQQLQSLETIKCHSLINY
jgi:hypothetical protein